MNRRTGASTVNGGAGASRGTVTVPAAYLVDLATRGGLSGSSWRVLAAVLAAPDPISARSVARQLERAYPFIKRLVRELRRRGLLEATSAGLVAILDPCWERAGSEPAAATANVAPRVPGRPLSRRRG